MHLGRLLTPDQIDDALDRILAGWPDDGFPPLAAVSGALVEEARVLFAEAGGG